MSFWYNYQDFAENVDFVSFTPISEKPLGGRPSTEYLLTIDTAKHLSMMEQTEIGKQVRLAFIEAEKELILKKQTPQVPQLPQNYIEALECLVRAEKDKLALENTVKEKELVIQEKDERLETARQVFKKVADNSGCRGFRECSIDLGIPQKDLRERLEKNKWICPKAKDKKGNKVLKPTVSGSQYDYVKYIPKKSVKLENGKVAKEFVITEKGYNKLLQQLGKVEK